jgi:hypothetical protein
MHSGANTTLTANGSQIMESTKLFVKNNQDVTGTLDASTEVKAGTTKVTLTGHKHSVPNSGTGVASDSATGVG